MLSQVWLVRTMLPVSAGMGQVEEMPLLRHQIESYQELVIDKI